MVERKKSSYRSGFEFARVTRGAGFGFPRGERAEGTEVFRSHALVNLGWAYRGAGDLHSAARVLVEALDRLTAMENLQGVARALEGLVAVMLDVDRVECAGELFGAAEAARRAVGAPVWTSDILSHTALEKSLQERLSLEGQLAAWKRGLVLEIDQAVALAHRTVTIISQQ